MSEAHRAEQLVAAGWAFYRAGNRRAALREFAAALAINPDSIEALTGVSQAHISLGEFDAAEAAADRLLQLGPNSAQAHRIKGEVCRRKRRVGTAAGFFLDSIRLDPNDPLGYHYLAVVQFEQKNYRRALQTVRKGRELAPWYGVLAAQQALILLHSKGPKAAEPFANEALQIGGDEDYVLTIVARVALMRGRLQKARDLLETVLRRDANDEEAISLYLLTEPGRYRLLRAHVQFPYWRKDHGVFGWIVWLAVWALLFAVLMAVAIGGRVPAFFVAVAYQLFWRTQYGGHRKRVRAHFAKLQLKPGF